MSEKLQAIKREQTGRKVRHLRDEGKVPGVVYGHTTNPIHLSVDAIELRRMYESVGETTVITLEIEGKKKQVILRELQRHPISGDFLHIDFFEVSMKETLEANIAIEVIGESPAIKEKGGILAHNMDELPIRCLPADLPSEITIDITQLTNIHDVVRAKDVIEGLNVELLIDPESILVSITEPQAQTEEDTQTEEPALEESPLEEKEEEKTE